MKNNFFVKQMPIIGEACQEKLKKSSVLIAGIGGLGCGVSETLIRSGIGKLYIVDYDKVDLSNIHRQFLYSANDAGGDKLSIAIKHLSNIGLDADIIPINKIIDRSFNIPDVDVVVDCLDNIETRFILSDLTQKIKRHFIHGGVYGYFGQVLTLFDTPIRKIINNFKKQKNYVIPQTVRIISDIQSMEVLKILCGMENNLLNRILTIDLFNYDFSIIQLVV